MAEPTISQEAFANMLLENNASDALKVYIETYDNGIINKKIGAEEVYLEASEQTYARLYENLGKLLRIVLTPQEYLEIALHYTLGDLMWHHIHELEKLLELQSVDTIEYAMLEEKIKYAKMFLIDCKETADNLCETYTRAQAKTIEYTTRYQEILRKSKQ